MSGIAGFVNLDGAAADPGILGCLMEAIAFRGPDGQARWTSEAACLGHTLLKTTDESEKERQPFSIDGNAWIVADARIDARRELTAELKGHGQDAGNDSPDVELILRAWHVWQEECVEHLLGDFAFAIWDDRRRLLFCARDQMGVKPFYYAHLGQSVIFSNTLGCVRRHPAVSDRLNDLAIADFLLFHANQDSSTSAFADIQRIPPAHCITWSQEVKKVRRYWTLPIDEPIFYRRRQDYIERFQELLRDAVGDRLRTNRVAVFMSGGLDSPTLAAAAHVLLKERSGDTGVRAFTMCPKGDEDRNYADLVAAALGFPLDFRDTSTDIDPEWYQRSIATPEPVAWPTNLIGDRAYYRHMASHSRVVFYGEGPDNALIYEWRPYLNYLLDRRLIGHLLYALISHVILTRKLPARALIRCILPYRSQGHSTPSFPDWVSGDLEKRLQLRVRWEEVLQAQEPAHPIRPASYQSFTWNLWQEMTMRFDAESSRAELEVRHPYLDLRLLRYLLAIPVIPWCRSKYIIRASMRGVLPEAVLCRPKTPGRNYRWPERMLELGMPPLLPAPQLEKYVDLSRLSPASETASFWNDFRTRSLAFWLRNLSP